VIGARGLIDDDDGKNDGLKWKLAESVHWRNNIVPLVHYRHFQNSRVDRFFFNLFFGEQASSNPAFREAQQYTSAAVDRFFSLRKDISRAKNFLC
jgi:hypothetical protein